MGRSGKIVIGLGLVLFPGLSFSQSLFESSLQNTHEINVSNSLSLGGFIRSVTYLGKTPAEEIPYLQSCYGQAGLIMDVKAGRIGSARAELRYRYGTEFESKISEWDLREAYIDITAGPVDFRIGKQIISWGKGTVFNPTQRLTPLDPLVRSPDQDDLKLGNWALGTGITLGIKSKLSGYWLPVYAPSRLLIEPVPMPDYITFADPGYPDVKLKNGSYGLKYDLFLGALDASVSWFDGFNHLPGIAFRNAMFDSVTLAPDNIVLAEEAYRAKMLGLDFAIPAGSWIFRFEGAWQHTNGYPEKEYIPFPELSYEAEIEWTGSNLTVVAGYYGKYILDYAASGRDPELSISNDDLAGIINSGITVTPDMLNSEITGRISAFNRLYNYQMEEIYHNGFVVIKSNFFHNFLELELPAVYNFTTDEWTLRPSITCKPADGIHIKAGYEGYIGPASSLYDMIGPVLNSGFLSVKIMF